MVNIRKLLNRKIIFWCIVLIILELVILIPLSKYLTEYFLLFEAIISLSTGIYGILIGFDLNRIHERSQFDLKMKKIFESFISEIAFNLDPLKKYFSHDREAYQSYEYKITVWEIYKEQIGEAAVDNVRALTDIYYETIYFKELKDVDHIYFQYLKEAALGLTSKMEEWVGIILSFYKKEGIKLEIKKETIELLSKNTDLDLSEYTQ